MKIDDNGSPVEKDLAGFSYIEHAQECGDPDWQPAGEKQDGDYSTCGRYTTGPSLAPGRLYFLHCRLDGGGAAGWIRSDARVLLSLAVDDDADDAAI